jgi:N-acetylglucosaminylphosphatidylinositol deacetylase
MFMSPTLLHLTSPELGNHLKILCLSTGNADGLGATRRKELEKSALTLGVRKREDVFIMDDARFQDGMQNNWSPDEIAKLLAQAFAPPPSPPPASTPISTTKHGKKKPVSAAPVAAKPEGPRATIDVLITFDEGGVSGHPNHIALHAGARRFIANIMRGYAGWKCPVMLYTLPTVNIVRKYSFVGDAVVTMAVGVVEKLLGGDSGKGKAGAEGERVLFVNDLSKYWKARDAMVRGHESQMVWFRWGWISLGRYMVVNDLKRERVAGT